MRASMLALAGILVCAASATTAQVVIDVESLRATPQDQPVEQPQVVPQVAPQVTPQATPQATPEPTPKVESSGEPKSDGPAEGGRFTFNRIENGFLRLDTQSGQVAYCRTQTTGWACQPVPENRSDLEGDVTRLQADMTALKSLKSEIVRLQEEIAALRREVAALKEPPPPRPPANLTSPDKGPDVTIRLPTHEDVARARAFIERAWQRVVEMITTVQKDVMQKS